MPPSGSIQNQARAGGTNGNYALPRDVLARVLLGFPASDLRRFRRVCKEWCEVISDPAFMDAHIVHGPRALTHTILFFPGYTGAGGDMEPRIGDGYLFDEQWRLVARFTAGESEDMVGTCNGLLCFLDVHQGGIRVVEPFTGESLALPPTPETKRPHSYGAYCFGFDPSSKRYKVLHQYHGFCNTKKDFYVYTIGGGDNWRRVHDASVSRGDPVFADGSMWWWPWPFDTNQQQHPVAKIARFDLATEEVTLEAMELVGPGTVVSSIMTTGSDARLYAVVLGSSWDTEVVFCMGEDGRWAQYCSIVDKRYIAWRHPLQRGRLLLEDHENSGRRGIYACPIAPTTASNDLGSEKRLIKIYDQGCPRGDDTTPRCDNTRGLFVPVQYRQQRKARVRRVPHQERTNPRTFCYSPPVSPAPFSHYFGKL